jgi:hypothetical protein
MEWSWSIEERNLSTSSLSFSDGRDLYIYYIKCAPHALYFKFVDLSKVIEIKCAPNLLVIDPFKLSHFYESDPSLLIIFSV